MLWWWYCISGLVVQYIQDLCGGVDGYVFFLNCLLVWEYKEVVVLLEGKGVPALSIHKSHHRVILCVCMKTHQTLFQQIQLIDVAWWNNIAHCRQVIEHLECTRIICGKQAIPWTGMHHTSRKKASTSAWNNNKKKDKANPRAPPMVILRRLYY
jgi:hypothetical protein